MGAARRVPGDLSGARRAAPPTREKADVEAEAHEVPPYTRMSSMRKEILPFV